MHEQLIPAPIRRRRDAEDNVLPLINVVFLLLIFFMVAGTLVQEPPFAVEPPASSHAGSRDSEPLYLALGAHGQLAWEGKEIDREALVAELSARPEKALQVRADRAFPAHELTSLLADLNEAGIAQIQLLTRHQP